LLGQPVLAAPEKYELDPEHTAIAFTVQHINYAATLGLFGQVEGSFTYDMDTQELSDVTVTISADSIETFNEARDRHLRSGDFLNVEQFPTITFTAQGGTPGDATSGQVTGELTLLGETRPITLDINLVGEGPYPFGHKRYVLGLSIRGSLMRSDFGMTYGVANGLVGDEIQLLIETEAMRLE
jgi:polyisoprenoid-binding protein YceI